MKTSRSMALIAVLAVTLGLSAGPAYAQETPDDMTIETESDYGVLFVEDPDLDPSVVERLRSQGLTGDLVEMGP